MNPPQTEMHQTHTPLVIPRPEHNITRSNIDRDALKVLYRLHRHGHIAYLVGGGVRDLLLGRKPKDFDISTSAHPYQVKKLFANCRLIGRRFRLAHIYFRGGKIIEVSTFRTTSEFNTEDGPIRSDNTFGTPAEDAFRRDFSVNALFYNISDFSIIDYVDGLRDLEGKVIRTIGDPAVRFEEDPIRMLRGIRFASLLDFAIDRASENVINSMREEIWQGAVPRILDEVLRMFGRGQAVNALLLLKKTGLLATLFPEIDRHTAEEGTDPYTDILSRLDESYACSRELSPSLILSALYYPLCNRSLKLNPGRDKIQVVRDTISPISERLQVPRKVQDTMRQSIAAQSRLFDIGNRRYKPGTVLRKSYFGSAMELFELAAGSSSNSKKLIEEWKALERNFSRGKDNRPKKRGTGRRRGQKARKRQQS